MGHLSSEELELLIIVNHDGMELHKLGQIEPLPVSFHDGPLPKQQAINQAMLPYARLWALQLEPNWYVVMLSNMQNVAVVYLPFDLKPSDRQIMDPLLLLPE